MGIEEDKDDDEAMIITSKLHLVFAAKSRRRQYTSSPLLSHHIHMSLSLSSSPDDSSHSRASVPFSWEEEPGKPKHQLLRHPSYSSKCLKLPPRLLLPAEFTKMPLPANHHRLARLKRWFRWRKERAVNDDVAEKVRFIFPSEDEDDMKTTRRRGLHCLSDVTRCYFWEVPWKNKKLKKMALEGDVL